MMCAVSCPAGILSALLTTRCACHLHLSTEQVEWELQSPLDDLVAYDLSFSD
jgi:hypothetical protein